MYARYRNYTFVRRERGAGVAVKYWRELTASRLKTQRKHGSLDQSLHSSVRHAAWDQDAGCSGHFQREIKTGVEWGFEEKL